MTGNLMLPLGAAATLLLIAARRPFEGRRRKKPVEVCLEAGRGEISAGGLEEALGWGARVTQLVITPTNDPERERVKVGLSSRQPAQVMERLARIEGVTQVRRTG